jgi:hypothetical protein
MIGFIYETTNLITGKKYIGKRQINWNPNEVGSYLGSSKLLKEDIDKYGEENFERDILDTADTKIALAELEIEYLRDRDVVSRDDYYNLTIPRLSWSEGWEQKREDPSVTERRANKMRGVKRGKYNVRVKFRNLDADKAAKLIKLHESGLTPWQIHKEIDYSARSITNYLESQNIVPNKVKGWQSKWTDAEKRDVLCLYEGGCSAAEIAKHTKRNVRYIISLLKEHDVTIRNGNHYKQ